MNSLLEISNEELELVIQNTADKLNMSKAIVEKDLWVCIILKFLFTQFKYKDAIVFKGGTSLSKVYKLIERFSEDIDLALDWKVLGYSDREPYETRSNTKQLKFNEKLNEDTKIFLRNEFLPILQNHFRQILKDKAHNFYIDEFDGQTICFDYPKKHRDSSILQVIRLEIGSLAEPIPASNQKIKTYIEEVYPEVFNENIEVVAVDSLRTFYEKVTILHREANRGNGNYPTRYSRHFYDVYKMILTDIKAASLKNIDLLQSVIDFKKKFYSSNWAKYDEIMEGHLKLIPSEKGLEVFSKDYDSMKNMLFGEKITFDTIITEIKRYESLINEVIKNN
ncbi:nucleotidyl transferase AbiEii/AbiGii toxin family protein [Aerococcaceae bacterium zg-ZJ1578]|uniref:nucleotidyl transferase AbiEii/AbiGii toxin family protein n=1 Tax=Aerococcaceae bacterium zg-252 TaxID=2796928 RepID=UPI001A18E6EB|nr:nucleotidyl transferase AbiEii/AbiGii toxin family protein [Aerococcaceae bacterium zg-1578]